MAINFNIRNTSRCGSSGSSCISKDGCPSDRCPDFTIRRHDTQPSFKVTVEDCEGPLDLQGLIVEANMWALAKLKKNITENCEYFSLASNVGFEQIMVGDIIALERVRSPEYMLVIGFDECNNLVRVQRGYRGTTPSKWKRGTTLRIFRVLNAPAQTEMIFEDIEQVDGTVERDVISSSHLVYEWSPEDVCLPGCYWMEFKLLKMKGLTFYLPGGHWTGDVNQSNSGTYYTGEVFTDSSVKLTYDSVSDRYLISANAWEGAYHLYSGTYYTGSTHNDGSVPLNRDDMPVDDDVSFSSITEIYDTGSIIQPSVIPSTTYSASVVSCSTESTVSCDVSFSNPSFTSENYGCYLGEGVEWVRRFPMNGEGFLIKIENTPTTEFLGPQVTIPEFADLDPTQIEAIEDGVNGMPGLGEEEESSDGSNSDGSNSDGSNSDGSGS